jgi:hypothetical protein
MKKLLPIFFLFVFTLSALAQERNSAQPHDTTLSLLRFSTPVLLNDTPAFALPLSFALTTAGDELPQYFYQSFAESPQIFSLNHQAKIDLTGPLKLQLKEEDNNRTWKITLGAANLGAVAYIAYQHVKKYGLK